MQVQIVLLEEIRIDLEPVGVRADPAQRGLHRLLHNFAQVAGQHQALARAGHLRGLDEERVAAGGRPSKAHRDPRIAGTVGDFSLGAEPRRSQHLFHDLR